MGKETFLKSSTHTYDISGCTIKFVSSVSGECVPSFSYHTHTIYTRQQKYIAPGYFALDIINCNNILRKKKWFRYTHIMFWMDYEKKIQHCMFLHKNWGLQTKNDDRSYIESPITIIHIFSSSVFPYDEKKSIHLHLHYNFFFTFSFFFKMKMCC